MTKLIQNFKKNSRPEDLSHWILLISLTAVVMLLVLNEFTKLDISLSTSSAAHQQSSVNLSWEEPSDYYAGIAIVRSTTDYVMVYDRSQEVANLPVGSTQYRDNNVSPGVTYYYSIFTYDDKNVYSTPVNLKYTVKNK